MSGNFIGKLKLVVLLILVAINAMMLIRMWSILNTNTILLEKKSSYILPDGFTPERTKITWDESLPPPSGWVVRYASSGCIFCKLDYEWEYLTSLLERLNYRTIILLPSPESQFEYASIIPKNAQQMAFVKMDWKKQFRFTGTPMLIIFDSNGRVLWHRAGMLNESDYWAAKKVIENNAKNN